MTTDNFGFYLQNRLIQTSQTGGQWYSDTSPFSIPWLSTMEQHDFKNVNNCLNINIYLHLETSGGQSSNLYLNAVHFFNTGVNYISVAA
jgi:hypothetical protein